MPEPSKIPEAWAVAGDYNAIPTADPGNGLASWDYGFPVETQTPLAAGGIPPRRQDINGALYWLSLGQLWNQQGGLWQYDAGENYEIGNVVEQNNAMYYCKAPNGPNSTVKSPSADTAGTYWKKLVNADGTLNVPVISNASTTVKGIVELATSAETKALTDATRAVTPSSLNGLLSLSPAALTVPKADSSGKLTGWLDALKDIDGRVNISIKGTAPKLQTARTVRVSLGSTSTASFDGTTNITPGVSGTLAVSNGGTGQTNLDLVTVGKAKALNTARTVRTNLASTSTASFDGTANITPGVTGTLPVTNGGTGQTNLDAVTVGKAKALNTTRTIQTNLASTSAANFNGTANVTPGVTGVLPISNGGTGSSVKNFVDLTTFQKLSANKRISASGKGWEIASTDQSFGMEFRTANDGLSGGICLMGSGDPVLWRVSNQNRFYGLASSSNKLETSRTLQTDLSSTSSAAFDGTANVTLGVTGTLAVGNGGTGETNLDAVTVGKAKALNTARNIQTNLASTSAASFNGTANIAPGVTGTLAVSNGGTGQTNLDAVTVGTAKHLTNSGIIEVLQSAYPVGSIYISYNSTSPATLFGFGTWQKIEGRFLLGSSSAYALNSTGGSAAVTLTIQQIPSHTHTASTASAGGHTHTVTINSAGSHSHSRGTMNITGTFSGVGQKYDDDPATLTGAFYVVNTVDEPPQGVRLRNDQGARDDYFGFDASRSWTGATTSEGYHTHGASTATAGAHTHTITVGNTGNGNAHDNMPPYIVVTIWRRTA